MKRILIVSHTYQAAKRRFHDMMMQNENAISNYSLHRLTIDIGDTQYIFASASSPDKMMGITYESIIIDEMVELTSEQTSFIMSRKRPYQPGI